MQHIFYSKSKKITVVFKTIVIKGLLIGIFSLIWQISLANEFSLSNRQIKSTESRKKIDDLFLEQLSFTPTFDPKVEFFNDKGEKIPLKNFRGNFVILYFFSSWCTSCIEELKSFSKMANELNFQDIKDIAIVAIYEDFKSYDKASKFFSSININNISYYLDDKKKAFTLLKVNSLPTTFFVDKKGFIILKTSQNHDWSDKHLINKIISIKDGAEVATDNGTIKEYDNNQKSDIINNKSTQDKTTIIN